MPRSIWKGSISFGLVHIPVGLYPAEKPNDLSFSMLDRRDLAPVGYRRYNKRTGDDVPSEEIVKGYEYEEDRYVVLDTEDFRAANAEATQTVELVEFVDAAEIDPEYFAKPYYLAPLKRGRKGYALLRETLRRTSKVGVARVVIRTREYIAALLARGPVMVLDLLRFADELRDPAVLDVPGEDLSELEISPKELEMAERLVAGMVEEWDPTKFRNEYRDDLLGLIREKAETGQARAVAAPSEAAEEAAGAEVVDIMTALKKSVESGAAKRREGPGRKTA